jgi:hypothetical protein
MAARAFLGRLNTTAVKIVWTLWLGGGRDMELVVEVLGGGPGYLLLSLSMLVVCRA